MTNSLAYAYDDDVTKVGISQRVDSWRDDVPSPSFEPHSYANREMGLAAKLAGRRNAAAIPQNQVDELYAERKRLLDKQFFGEGFSPADRRRLALIRWKIDCVIDARHGAHVDRLEDAIRSYKLVASDIKNLKEELISATMNNRKAQNNGRQKRQW